jgi:biopolymer transport protein ExbD
MLVLVVIFILTATLLTTTIKLTLPKAEAGQTSDAPRSISLVVDRSGQAFLDDRPLALTELSQSLQSTAARFPDAGVQLRADENAPYGKVIEVLGLAQKAGLTRVGFVTSGPAPAGRRVRSVAYRLLSGSHASLNVFTAHATPVPPMKPGMWSIRGPLPSRTYWGLAVTGLVLPLLLWWGLVELAWLSKVFLPSPVMVWNRCIKWFTTDRLASDVGISCYRVIAGWLLSAVLALPLGLFIGTFRPLQALLEPLMEFVRYMPAVAFIPLVMIWVGIEEGAKIAIIFIGTFFQMILMVAEDVRRVPSAQIEAARKGPVAKLIELERRKNEWLRQKFGR